MQRRQQSFLILMIAVIILIGVILRVRQYVVNRSLWIDEAMLALNIVDRSFAELTQPLDYGQGAPVGFLFLQKIIIQGLGNKDYILRLLPLIAGIVAIFLMYNVAKRYVGVRGVPVALGLFAVSVPLIYYTSEVKQYSTDVMSSLLLLFVAYNCLEVNSNLKQFTVLGFVGALSMWLSHPALFVMVGISLSLTLDLLMRRDWPKLSWLGGVLFFWLINFVVLYLISLRFLATNTILINYWRDSFMPVPPWHNIAWFHEAFSAMLTYPVGLTNVSIGIALLFVGCVSLFFRKWQLALILIMPFLTTLVASGLEKYPFSDRLLLFIVPIVFLLVAEGIERPRLILLKFNPLIAFGVWIILVSLLLYKPINIARYHFLYPKMEEHIKPIMAYLSQNRQNTDTIYIYYGARPAFTYYALPFGFEDGDYIFGVFSRQDPDKYIQEINELNGRKRVWFVFSHNCRQCTVNEEAFFLEYLGEIGMKIDELKSPRTSVYLYDLSSQKP